MILFFLLMLCFASTVEADVEIPVCWPCEGGK
jgi:hypothetical protein